MAMNADTIRGQQDAYNRWHDKAQASPITGATELPYIKPGRTSHRHKETFPKPLVKNKYGEIVCECGEKMRLVIDEYYCEKCHASVMKKEIA